MLSRGHSCRAFSRGADSLALHTWGDTSAELSDVFYVHGLQSHAGWLFETGPALLDRGVRLTALDRRGSGRSPGRRGHLDDAAALLDDYAAALAALADTATAPITVVGQSFGGSVLAALVATGRVPESAAVVLCAPALGQQRARMDAAALDIRRLHKGSGYTVVRIEDEQYTDVPEYLRVMANDGLMVRSLTDSFRSVMVEIEDLYVTGGAGPWSDRDVFVALPAADSIIDQAASLAVLEDLAPHARLREFPTTSHFLEFTPARTGYWDWLAGLTVVVAAC